MKRFLDLCRLRASVRQFSPRLPERADVDYVMECLRLAPSAVNRQPWRVRYVTTPSILLSLCESYPREWIKGAPAIFVVSKLEDEQWVRPADGHGHGEIDAAIAIEHLYLAAAECGLGTCWVCNFEETICRRVLDLPRHETPVAMIPVGYPAQDFLDGGRKRKGLQDIFMEV